MKRFRLLYLCILFIAGLSVFSCTRYGEEQENGFDEGSLNAAGQAFMKAVKTNPDWEKSWNEILKTGTPLVNEAACFLSSSSGLFYAFPVVSKGEITRLVFYPLNFDAEAATRGESEGGVTVGDPKIFDTDSYADDKTAGLFIKSETFKGWVEKGYKSSFKELESVYHFAAHDDNIQTRSTTSYPGNCFYYNEIEFLIRFYAMDEYVAVNTIYGCLNYAARDMMNKYQNYWDLRELRIPNIRYESPYWTSDPIRMYFTLRPSYSGLLPSPSEAESTCRGVIEDYRRTLTIYLLRDAFRYYATIVTFDYPFADHRCTSNHDDYTKPDPAPVVTLSVSKTGIPLMESYSMSVEVYPITVRALSTKIEMRRKSTDQWEPVGSGMSCTHMARNPGIWEIQATTVTDRGTISSEIVTVTHQFPNSTTIFSSSVVKQQFDYLWQETKKFATDHRSTYEVREAGAWVWLDTRTNAYSVECDKGIRMDTVALLIDVEEAYVDSWPPDDECDLYDPNQGGKFYVAHFHTHFPICYAQVAVGQMRVRNPCGPTNPKDHDVTNGFRVPGFVYDYTGPRLLGTHQINDPAHTYPYGSYDRREVRY